jgi:hypothetical protein
MVRTVFPSKSSLDASYWQFPVAIKYTAFILKTTSSLKRRMAGIGVWPLALPRKENFE